MHRRFRAALGRRREARATVAVDQPQLASTGAELPTTITTTPQPQQTTTQPESSPSSSQPKEAPSTQTAVRDEVKENVALNDALRRFCARLPNVQKDAFKEAATEITEANLLDRIRFYDESHRDRSTFRGQAATVSRFLRLLDTFMGGVSIGIQSSPEISSLVVGGVRLILDIALKFVTFFEGLTDMLCLFGQYIEVLAEYSKAANIALVQKAVAKLYEDLLTFCWEARKVFVDEYGQVRQWTSVRVFIRVQWEPFQETFGKIKANFEQHLNLLQHSTGAIQLNLLLDFSRTAEADRNRKATTHLVEERKKFLRWLSKLDFEATHIAIHSKQHSGTGGWLTTDPLFRHWFTTESSQLLWCHGKAGVGKSVLCSHVLEFISSNHGMNPHIGIVFAYCRWDHPETQKLSQIMAVFMRELSCRLDYIPRELLDIFHSWDKNNKPFSMTWDRSQNKALFLNLGQRFKQIFIIIDALDECHPDDRRDILSFVLEICSGLPCVKVFLTSRPEKDIGTMCERSKVPTLRIETENVSDDIRHYIADHTEQLILEERLVLQDPVLKETIVWVLSERAEGMFLWANLQLSRLCHATKDRHIRDMLETLPRGMNGTYDRILNQIEQQEDHLKNIAFQSLIWVLYAKKPLAVDEFRNAVSMDDSVTSIEQLDIESLGNILAACANILVEDHGRISLVHFSAQEYLMKRTNTLSKTTLLSTVSDANIAHNVITKTCVRYLCLTLKNNTPWDSFWSLRSFCRTYPFCWHAAYFFDYYARSLEVIPDNLLKYLDELLNAEITVLDAILKFRARELGSIPISIGYAEAKYQPAHKQHISLFHSSKLSEIQELEAIWSKTAHSSNSSEIQDS